MYKIVLIRHGQSEWNKKGLFTGWTDVDLTPLGVKQAKEAGQILKKNNYYFDLCYTSFLKRAIKTLDIILEEMNLVWLPVVKDWRLNEKHYGDLQGLNKKEMAKKFGEEQVLLWRRSYNVRPPEIKKSNPYNQTNSACYSFLKKPVLAESLEDVVKRTMFFWNKVITSEIKAGKKILISASGNSLRAIVKGLNCISDEDIVNLDIPYSVPIVYELDRNLKVIKWYYLGDKKKIDKLVAEIKDQGKIN
ncbi:MAG: 2,3-diphosphoglycerate-dependent phosphoglycerate mutase [Patescibacteria group bacterium]|jgi:2,3-bisphosphoglycerate-dependent phosphoglycerate mutase